MTTHIFFCAIVLLVIFQRLYELHISKKNTEKLLQQGGRLHAPGYQKVITVLQILWFIAMLIEVWLFERPFIPWLVVTALMAAVIGQVLRYLSMKALGSRWTISTVSLPNAPIIKAGIYRYLKHPNWLGVVLEIPAIPLVHGAYLTAILFSIGNAILLLKRIQLEEEVLSVNRPTLVAL